MRTSDVRRLDGELRLHTSVSDRWRDDANLPLNLLRAGLARLHAINSTPLDVPALPHADRQFKVGAARCFAQFGPFCIAADRSNSLGLPDIRQQPWGSLTEAIKAQATAACQTPLANHLANCLLPGL